MKISDLPEKLKELALLRQRESGWNKLGGDNDLASAFSWQETKEGAGFWFDIDEGEFPEEYKDPEIEFYPKEFLYWLTENAELSDMIWSYDSEDWTLEGIFKQYNRENEK